MCEACVESVRRYFPDATDANLADLLICATPFPAGGPQDVERCLREAHEAGCATVPEAIVWASEQMDRDMEAANPPRFTRGGPGVSEVRVTPTRAGRVAAAFHEADDLDRGLRS